jgi:Sec-independent protein translocase protein TatA
MSLMPSLTPSELGIVLFIVLLVAAAGRLPKWGEWLGGYFHRRGVRPQEPPPGDN